MPENQNSDIENTENTEITEITETTETAEPESPPKKSGRFKDSVFGTAVILGIISVVTVVAISLMNSATAPVIEKKLAEEKAEAVTRLFGADAKALPLTGFEDIYQNFAAPVTEVLIVREDNGIGGEKTSGYCVTVTPKGFTDSIVMLVAINTDVTVQNTLILSMKETAGYGTKLDSEGDSWFREQFKKKARNIAELRIEPAPGENAVQIIAGATVSSKAFVRGVNAALEIVSEIKNAAANTTENTESAESTEITEEETEDATGE